MTRRSTCTLHVALPRPQDPLPALPPFLSPEPRAIKREPGVPPTRLVGSSRRHETRPIGHDLQSDGADYDSPELAAACLNASRITADAS